MVLSLAIVFQYATSGFVTAVALIPKDISANPPFGHIGVWFLQIVMHALVIIQIYIYNLYIHISSYMCI